MSSMSAVKSSSGPEALDVDGGEAVAGIGQLLRAQALAVDDVAVDGAAEHAGEDVHEHAEPVALVAAELAGASERREEARGENLAGIRGGPRLLVESPALGDGLAPARGDAELAHGHRGGGHVEHVGLAARGGRGHADRIRAHHGLAAEGRGHGHEGRVGEGESDHAAVEGHHRVVGARSEVIRVAHGHDAHAVGRRLGDGQLHGHHARRMPQALLPVHQSGGEIVACHRGLRGRVDEAQMRPLDVLGEHADAVGVDAAEIGAHHEIGGEARVLGRHLEGLEHRHDEIGQPLVVDDDGFIGHGDVLSL